eukprot:TRINITY_DN2596_c0_g1_i1.p1 TRINITY_DN2596_c0_g1~~TRINITY_DN2596_c0_g1_i1.p1  ORF type:complete len:378 (+),score=151.77 TRINITY_DN2596_c0_g1_i1:77-1210(+)
MSNYSKIDTIGDANMVVALASCHQGQMKEGVDHGWVALTGEPQLRHATFVDFRDVRKFQAPVRGSVLMGRNMNVAMAQASKACGTEEAPPACLCLGGDHTISIGTIMATRKVRPTTRVIWIDAHPDINCPESSLSGNCHGMPVAHVMNLVDGFRIDNHVQPHEFCYIGIRDIDDAEQVRIDEFEKKGMLVFRADDINRRGMKSVLEEIDAKWGKAGATEFDFPIHISLDIDSMDPQFTPATGTPVDGGIHPEHVKQLLRWANGRAHTGLCHLDVVELNPYLATAHEAAKTVSYTQDVMRAYLNTHRMLPAQQPTGLMTMSQDLVHADPEGVSSPMLSAIGSAGPTPTHGPNINRARMASDMEMPEGQKKGRVSPVQW